MAPTFDRDLEMTKRGGQKTGKSMCKLSGSKDITLTTTKSDKTGKPISILTTRYTANAKCEPRNKSITLVGNRRFKCRPINQEIKERTPGSTGKIKNITVGCEVFIFN
ncbi:Hypothetical predicted protein [Paramuricea clavata]|uniref:Uncharacterized protein n=1 Tax=Paramuricea clavata TaxID=317549 RepID=A0A7D9ECX5_PARCT|nr:Hypothetical predicted protein [Paramuricea clavata]